jgi:hypothetical protein
MAHADGPGQLGIKVESAANGGGNGSDMKTVLHTGTDMVIARGKEDLRLMLEPPEGRRVDYRCGVAVIGAAYIALSPVLALLQLFQI